MNKRNLVVALVLLSVPAFAIPTSEAQAATADIQKTLGFVPGFFKSFSAAALPGAWEEMKTLQLNPNTAISPKYKELIGLAVSAQIPCTYCILAHTEFAKANGATQEEISLAVAAGGQTRHWSTFFNGVQLDQTKFKEEINKVTERMKKMDPKAAPPQPIKVVDAQSAYKDIEQTFGFVPDFLKKFPANSISGAWREMRDVQMNPNGVIPSKYLSLISLAVAAQVPCHYCVVADTEFAKLGGATEAEINEAVAMAAHTRNMSTLLNGMQVDETAFKNDVARLTKPKGKSVAKQ
jgi:AhpD family alkylhydroperoxidase